MHNTMGPVHVFAERLFNSYHYPIMET